MIVWPAIEVIGWIAAHWFQLILIIGFFIIIAQLRSISEAIDMIRSATNGIEHDIAVTSRAAVAIPAISTSLHKIENNLTAQIFDMSHNIGALSRDIVIVREVIEHGRKWRKERILSEIEQRRPARERRFAEMQEKAENGDVQASGNYARYLAMLNDHVQAHMWYTIAMSHAPEWQYGVRQREEIAAKMTSEQLRQAGQKAREWLDTHPAAK